MGDSHIGCLFAHAHQWPECFDEVGRMTAPPITQSLSAEDVAVQLRVTARRVRQIPPADLPYLQLGPRGPRRYDPADVDAYIAARLRGRP